MASAARSCSVALISYRLTIVEYLSIILLVAYVCIGMPWQWAWRWSGSFRCDEWWTGASSAHSHRSRFHLCILHYTRSLSVYNNSVHKNSSSSSSSCSRSSSSSSSSRKQRKWKWKTLLLPPPLLLLLYEGAECQVMTFGWRQRFGQAHRTSAKHSAELEPNVVC